GLTLWIAATIAQLAFPAIAAFGWRFFTHSAWNPVRDDYGVLAALYGTVACAAIAMSLAAPVGVGAAIVLSERILPAPLQVGATVGVRVLAAIPSVAYGFWGLTVLIPRLQPLQLWVYERWGSVPLLRTVPQGPGILAAGLVLAIAIVPFSTAIAQEALEALPEQLKQGALAVGASRSETVRTVLLPAAGPGIAAGLLLAVGRALGETMAVALTGGNATKFQESPLAPGTTIAALVANQFPEAAEIQVSALMYAALVLFALTLVANGVALAIARNGGRGA
ncbi:MAG: phosphate ABC transporter permease subunit PstC, partial [Cyanobacteria bacterium J06648_11]